jgi:mono/diheme cytochrome c family protein
MTRGRAVAALVLLAAAGAAALLVSILRHGFSARDEPTRLEAFLARTMRRYAVPAELRGRTNPVTLTPALLAEARVHFADHCASCHGNDGKGDTTLGRRMYPRAPDMTLAATQSQSDGELFSAIENGIRLTGMPAWGDGSEESARGSWTLVHFIRHLPRITPEELEEMETHNPRPRSEWEAESEAREFLEGK